METTLYESTWSTQPIYSVDEFVADILCNIASSALCERPDAGTWSKKRDLDSLQPRRLTKSAATGRSANNLEPTIGQAITGILNGNLSLHYVRFLSNTRNEMLVELAFWIGPIPGTRPRRRDAHPLRRGPVQRGAVHGLRDVYRGAERRDVAAAKVVHRLDDGPERRGCLRAADVPIRRVAPDPGRLFEFKPGFLVSEHCAWHGNDKLVDQVQSTERCFQHELAA